MITSKSIKQCNYNNRILWNAINWSWPSVLWCCWLGSRKGIRPVKNWVVGCWHDYLSGARCRWCHCHSLSLASVKSKLVLVPAHPSNLEQNTDNCKQMCVRACVHACVRACV